MAAQPLLNSLSPRKILRTCSNIEHSLPAAGIPPSALRGKYRYPPTNSVARAGLQPITACAALGTSYMTTPSRNASLLLSLCFSASAEAGASHYQFVPQESFTLLDRGREARRTDTAKTAKTVTTATPSTHRQHHHQRLQCHRHHRKAHQTGT